MFKDLSQTEVMNNGHLTNVVTEVPNYRNEGFRDAGTCEGKPVAFKVSLEGFFARLKEIAARKDENQRVWKQKVEAEIAMLDKESGVNAAKIENLKKKDLADLNKDIDSVRAEIRDIKENPDKYTEKSRDNFKYYKFMVLLVVLTFFLVVFYSSVIYSAFFRQIIASQDTIYNSVFYPNVFAEASRSFEMLLMVLLGPSVFIALGILYHNFVKDWNNPGYKHKLKTIAVLCVTFIFDSLLAYEISKKLHDAAAQNIYGTVQLFTIVDAVLDSHFWLVIFFGFAVYMVLGAVFSLFEKERNTKSALERILKGKENKLNELLGKEASEKNEIKLLEDQIHRLKIEITRLNSDSDKVYFSPNELHRIISEYTFGWMQFVTQGRYSDNELERIEAIKEQFYLNNIAAEKQ